MEHEGSLIAITVALAIVIGFSWYSYQIPSEISGIQYSNGTIIPIPTPLPSPAAYPEYYIYRNGTKSLITPGVVP
jgi:hypothetical protein